MVTYGYNRCPQRISAPKMARVLKFAFVSVVLCFLPGAKAEYECKQDINCKLPDCFCATWNHPLGVENIPQIVYFGFDDAVQPQVSGYYNQLFHPDRKNPNGCPITMTLYVSHQYTLYNLVNEYYKAGDEIGVHSVTHTDIDTREKLLREAREQKENIVQKGGVAEKDVVGWRSPNLKTAGDAQPEVLAELKYVYDNSLSYSHSEDIPWPFTLDYGYPYPCEIQPCPSLTNPHKGFWEVMIKSLTDPATGLPCGYVDGCRPDGEEAALEYLWWNFEKNYKTTRAPFGLNMHAAWFAVPAYMNAMQRFIDRLLTTPYVYIVNVKQMMAWMKTPVTLSHINDFAPWGCDGRQTAWNGSSSSGHVKAVTTPSQSTTSVAEEHRRPLIFNNDFEKSSVGRDYPDQSNTGETNLSSQWQNPNFLTWQRFIRNRMTKTPIALTRTYLTPTARSHGVTSMQTSPAEPSLLWQRFMQAAHHQDVDNSRENCIQEVNCKMPACFCRSTEPPKGLSPRDIPQIVYIAVDGHIDGLAFSSLLELFAHHRRNPNGCPISGTVFTPATGNYSPYIAALKSRGIRMGIRGGSYSGIFSGNSLVERVNRELSRSRIDMPEKMGWRGFANMAPSDEIYKVLAASGVRFDNSLITSRGVEASWPYTLDFGLQDACGVMPGRCPSGKYPGLWVVPVTPLTIPRTNRTCIFADTCPPTIATEDQIFNLLMENFQKHYSGKRVPFGLNIHSEWLYGLNKNEILAGISRFLDAALSRQNVVLISIEQMLEWMSSSDKSINGFSC